MASYKADNFLDIPHNGVYGNLSRDVRRILDIGLVNGGAGFASGDTLDLNKIPAGSLITGGFIMTGTVAIATSTVVYGLRAADGTSTMASGASFGTGTNVLFAGSAQATTAANTKYDFKVSPFTIDFDAIAYITFISPGLPTGTTGAGVYGVVDYVANSTK